MKILKFFSKTCGPCKQMGKILDNIKDIEIQEIDTDEINNSSLIEQYGVKIIPTTIIVDDKGGIIKSFKDVTPLEEIKEVIGQQIKI